MKWADLVFPPINLWSYPNMINEESNVKPVWKPKEVPADTINNLSHYSHEPKKVPADPINNPSHYTHGGIEVLDYLEAKGLDKDFHLANVIKYVSRAGYKINKLEDLKKARFYLDRRIKLLEVE